MIDFTIIIPVYNTEKYLKKCIDSALIQDYQSYEIIIVNDGSTDSSSTIIREYEDKYPEKVKVLNKENGGLSSARNFGIEHSKGKYLAFLDSDDWIAKEFLSKFSEKIDFNLSDRRVITCNREFVFEAERISDNLPKFRLLHISDKPEIIRSINLSACNKVFHRELFNNNLFPLGRLYEDIYPVTHAILNCDLIGMVDDVLYAVRKDNPNSITSNFHKNEQHLPENLEELRCYIKKNHSFLYEDFMFFYNKTLLSFYTKVVQNNRYDLVWSNMLNLLSYVKTDGIQNKIVLVLLRLRLFSLLSFLLRSRKKFLKKG